MKNTVPSFNYIFDTLLSDGLKGYPPYNVIRKEGGSCVVEVAVAGFKMEELSIQTDKRVLTISGKRAEKDNRDFAYQGIAGRAFELRFDLKKGAYVEKAALKDGILSLDVTMPPEEAPQKIEIVQD